MNVIKSATYSSYDITIYSDSHSMKFEEMLQNPMKSMTY